MLTEDVCWRILCFYNLIAVAYEEPLWQRMAADWYSHPKWLIGTSTTLLLLLELLLEMGVGLQ